MGKDITASDEVVKLFSDGSVETGQFYKISKDGVKTPVENATPTKPTTIKSKYLLLGKVNEAGGSLGSVVKNGNKIEYTNPAGKLLKWSEQGTNDITNAINTSKNLPVEANNMGRITEGKVGEFVKRKKNIESYGIVIKDDVGQVAAELDVTTLDEIIEVKASFSSVKEDQFSRLLNTTETRFANPYQKKVILYIDKPLSEATQGQINMINRIKGQGVTIVHSLEELGGVLK